MAPSRRVLVGIPAVLTAMPPGRGLGSTTATRFPKYAAWAAPFSPAGPAPSTTRSYFAAMRSTSSPGLASTVARQRPHAGTRRVLEEGAAHTRREGADVKNRLPAMVRYFVLDPLRYV